jgi:hypothetical protein
MVRPGGTKIEPDRIDSRGRLEILYVRRNDKQDIVGEHRMRREFAIVQVDADRLPVERFGEAVERCGYDKLVDMDAFAALGTQNNDRAVVECRRTYRRRQRVVLGFAHRIRMLDPVGCDRDKIVFNVGGIRRRCGDRAGRDAPDDVHLDRSEFGSPVGTVEKEYFIDRSGADEFRADLDVGLRRGAAVFD